MNWGEWGGGEPPWFLKKRAIPSINHIIINALIQNRGTMLIYAHTKAYNSVFDSNFEPSGAWKLHPI